MYSRDFPRSRLSIVLFHNRNAIQKQAPDCKVKKYPRTFGAFIPEIKTLHFPLVAPIIFSKIIPTVDSKNALLVVGTEFSVIYSLEGVTISSEVDK